MNYLEKVRVLVVFIYNHLKINENHVTNLNNQCAIMCYCRELSAHIYHVIKIIITLI